MIYENFECIEKYLEKYANQKPDRTAVIVKDSYTSYEQLWKLVCGFASFLKEECQVDRGDRVVVKVKQTLDLVVTYFAIHLCEATFVPLEENITGDKTLRIIGETQAKIYISKDYLCSSGVKWINLDKVVKIATSWHENSWNQGFPNLKSTADIMYTTGTTGRPKGVEVTHQTLIATAQNYISGFELDDARTAGGGLYVMAVPGPLNHVNPLRKLYMTIMSGNTIVILNGLRSMQGFFHSLDKHGVTALCLPPAALRTIWHMSGEKLAEYADQIDFVEVSTSPLTESDKKTLLAQLPNSRLYNNYGLSECGAMAMYDFRKYPSKGSGCVGKPTINSHIVVVDDRRREIDSSKNNLGLVANEGTNNMKGYWENPEKTAEVMENGFVYTNDLGYFDEEGFLYVVGRRDDTINVGGLKVQPTEVEDVALMYPGIVECLCKPVKDDITGNALKLYVVLKEGEEFRENDLRQYLAKHLLSYQRPKYFEKVESIPRNYVGKPDRKAFDASKEGQP